MPMKQNRIKITARILVLLALFSALFMQTASAENNDSQSYMVEKISVENGYFLNDFDPGVYNYDVIMSSFTYNLSISVELTDPRFEYEISGDDEITASSDSQNIVTVSVHDTLGRYETVEYYLNIYVGNDAISSIPWTGLSYLDVENGIFSPQFSRYRITYYAILENNIKSFDEASVNYRTINPDASVEIKCRDELNSDGTLKEGKRTEYVIKVTERSGKSKRYYLNLYIKAHITSSISDTAVLSNIEINGGEVNINFSSHRSYYDLTVPKAVKNLDIQAYPADRSDMVQVIGAESINDSQPVFVNILVTSPSEDTYSIYTLRLTYDNFFTPKYSDFQMAVYVVLIGSVLFVCGFFAARFMYKSKMRAETDTETEIEANAAFEDIEVTEDIEDENTPVV